jgi:hypothetical protein
MQRVAITVSLRKLAAGAGLAQAGSLHPNANTEAREINVKAL